MLYQNCNNDAVSYHTKRRKFRQFIIVNLIIFQKIYNLYQYIFSKIELIIPKKIPMSFHKLACQYNKKTHQIPRAQPSNSMHTANLQQFIRKRSVRNFIKNGLNIPEEKANERFLRRNQSVWERGQGLGAHLKRLKDQCSGLSREIWTSNQQIQRFKDKSTYVSDKSKSLILSKQSIEQKIAQVQSNIQKVSLKRQAALLSSKNYEHILQRMKKDKISLQLNTNQLQSRLKLLQKQFLALERKQHQALQFQKLSSNAVKDAYFEFQQQKINRKNQLTDYQNQKIKKVQQYKKLKQRKKQIEQIQQKASEGMQDSCIINYKNFLKALIFQRQMLKYKLTKLKKYYQPYQNAFLCLKFNTGIKDPLTLKKQFFDFQNSYAQKAKCVKNLQEQLNQQQKKQKQLKSKLLQSRIQLMQLTEQLQLNQKKKEDLNLFKMRSINEKSLNHELVYDKILIWIQIYKKKLKVNVGKDKILSSSEIFYQIIKALQAKIQQKQQKSTEKDQQILQKENLIIQTKKIHQSDLTHEMNKKMSKQSQQQRNQKLHDSKQEVLQQQTIDKKENTNKQNSYIE